MVIQNLFNIVKKKPMFLQGGNIVIHTAKIYFCVLVSV